MIEISAAKATAEHYAEKEGAPRVDWFHWMLAAGSWATKARNSDGADKERAVSVFQVCLERVPMQYRTAMAAMAGRGLTS